ncbi:MAG: radical SAM protein [Caldilineaceae bacterium]
MMTTQRPATIGLVELPELALYDSQGRNRSQVTPHVPLVSKQVLLASLQGHGYAAQLVNMKLDHQETEFGETTWGKDKLTKVYVGQPLAALDAGSYDLWGITNNFTQHREIACLAIKHLASQGRPVIVGGSDAIAEPYHYFQAGAAAIVTDKSGAANRAVVEYCLGNSSQEELFGVLLPNGSRGGKAGKPLSPEEWPLPSLEVAQACIGREYWSLRYPEELLPIGSIFPDIGCDRKCDFCQTPNYRLGYRWMSPERARQWLVRQKEAGARSILSSSDQFLGRVLWEGGRDEVLAIMQGMRDLGLSVLWPNGLELRKATLGRGFNRAGTDLAPDEELIQALWGWDGKVGAFHAFIPAERPVVGNENYAKLLPWKEHCEMLRAIVRAGIPALSYGVIIGFDDETEDSLLRLEEALTALHEELTNINPELLFQISAFGISPIPGTAQGNHIRQSGLLHVEDPSLFGGLWTPSIDTRTLSYEKIAEWQVRLLNIGTKKGISGFFQTDFSTVPDAVLAAQQA